MIRIASLLLAAGGLFLACAAVLPEPRATNDIEELALSRGIDPSQIVVPSQLSEEILAWLDRHIVRNATPSERLRRLLYALQDSKELDLEYYPGHTGTAQEVFATGQYNCLSFTHLFIGLAREIGLEAHYLYVGEIQRFHKQGDLVVVSGHITAGYGSGPDKQVLEFAVGPEVDYRTAKPISDIKAVAMYYSNRGAELLRDGDIEEAERWLATGTRMDPELADAWVNLGVVLRRRGKSDLAEQAYRKSIEVDPNSISGYHNLAVLMRLRGQPDAARQLLEMLDRRDNKNPYIYLALGDDSLQRGQFDDAARFFRRALHLSDEPAEAQAAMGQLALELGNEEAARGWLEKAQRRDPFNSRVEQLADRLDPAADAAGNGS